MKFELEKAEANPLGRRSTTSKLEVEVHEDSGTGTDVGWAYIEIHEEGIFAGDPDKSAGIGLTLEEARTLRDYLNTVLTD